MIKKVLIANRGEIALRVLRACKKLNIKTVAVHSTADRQLAHVKLADESVCIGGPNPKESYLNMPTIISAAELTNADAIHPGYGFLSESEMFAEIIETNKFKFIGPSSKVLNKMGDKIKAKKAMKDFGVPCIPGFDGVLPEEPDKEMLKKVDEIGYPIMLKAIHGGGGRGMMVVEKKSELAKSMNIVRTEAENAFGNGDLYFEKYFDNPRHIEIQIMSDEHGNAVHFGERDCSMQRRNQKIIEETQAQGISREEINKIGKICADACVKLGYTGAGTFEFLYQDGHFSFIEMNTRIQVEHPITEMVTGADLIKWQIRTHAGDKFPDYLYNMKLRGHSIECRINAEDPDKNFSPSAIPISSFHMPGGKGVRIDSHAYAGYEIPPYYDSLLGKLIVHSPDRKSAINRMERALEETIIEGPKTTIPFHQAIMKDKEFRSGDFDTNFLKTFKYKRTINK